MGKTYGKTTIYCALQVEFFLLVFGRSFGGGELGRAMRG